MTKHLFNKVMHSVSLCLTLVERLCAGPALSTLCPGRLSQPRRVLREVQGRAGVVARVEESFRLQSNLLRQQ